MHHVKFVAVSLIVLLAHCASPAAPVTSVPAEVQPFARRCRCVGPVPMLVEIEIADDPVTYRREVAGATNVWESGLEFHASPLRTMYPQLGDAGSSSQPPSSTFVARIVRSGPAGDAPTFGLSSPVPARGLHALAIVGPNAIDADVWNVQLLGIHPTTQVSAEEFFQFAAGTSVDRILDRAEWGVSSRGCTSCPPR